MKSYFMKDIAMHASITLPTSFRCGYFDCGVVFGDLTLSPKRTRTMFEIEYYLENGKHTYSAGNTYRIQKHHILIGRPGEVCNSELPFKTVFLKLEADGMLAEQLSSLPSYFPALHPFEIEQSFERLVALQVHSTKNSDALACVAELLSLLSMIVSDGKNAVADGTSTFLTERAKGYIRAHSAEAIKLSDIAAAINLSPSYFHSLFSATCGITPHDYLIECRLANARELLCATALSMDEIAQKCGFGSQQYMANVFQRHLGISPGKCRKSYREAYLQ